ncbi:hypothetical protein [Oceanobacillus massiliensis]|uniref:hypothetical protein n=1 Tax=Oceanobacillus massiliensis TaxID=1465765 RepID=UPI003019498C
MSLFDKDGIDNHIDNSWLTNYLVSKGLNFIDKRDKGGSLWVVGGNELNPIFKELATKDIYFQFTSKGSRSTKNQPGWYMK